ncbi:MAG: PilN domain-containing protein [Fimbriimonadaceae bacterium]|nr:PilN domain-containing protein [Fimbriimonadaceae bacterium]
MSRHPNLAGPVLEWSPTGVAFHDPTTGKTVTAESIQALGGVVQGRKHLLVALSRRTAFVKAVRLPALAKPELRQALRFSIPQHVPLEASETAYDTVPTADTDAEGRLTVIGAVRTTHLRNLLLELAAVGASAKAVFPSAFGAAAMAVEVGHPDCEVVQRTLEGLAIDVVRGGVTICARLIPDSGDLDLHSEIHRTCALVGGTPVYTIAAGGFDLAGAGRLVPTDTLDALSRHATPGFNLELPEVLEKRAKQAMQGRSRFALLLCLAALCLAVMVYLDHEDAKEERTRQQALINRDVQDAERARKDATAKLAALEKRQVVLDQAFDPAQPIGDVMAVVSSLAPPGLWLTGANFERGKPFILRGTAMTNAAVESFLAALAVESRFRDVKLLFANNGKIEETPVVQFSITMHIVGNLPVIERTKKTKGKTTPTTTASTAR